ncbi:MAG: Lipopolysaccharide export system permease protein [Hydrocarboniphaga sp.]|uniref:LptF/LptG family permease n=1 Tax=Hydrocarboniphaga sp. TaxID=2033016 RepID=UPI0026305EA3|nr:LptF/LptG family permease [Hydrocarboniphaga sp.]MDB5968139.1 Lipopolysaccharide export system permease protein [Hydrocarboniphaga sp.]
MIVGPLASYLRKLLLIQTLGVLIALTALLQLLEMLDVTTDILKRHLGLAGVLHYVGLRTASELVLALPLAMLIGSLFTFYTLARNHELIAIRAAGIRLRSMLGAMVPVALLFAAVQFVVADRIVPVAEARLADWWQATQPPDQSNSDDDKELSWFRTDDGLVSVEQASRDGQHLQGVTIYRRDAGGGFIGRIRGTKLDWADGHWTLTQMTSMSLLDGGVQRQQEPTALWRSNLRPEDLKRLDTPSLPMSSATLGEVLTGARVGDRPLSYYRTALYHSYAAPFLLMLMLLLALPSTQAVQRGGEGGGSLLIALAAGLGLVLSAGLMASLGQGGRVPPLAAVGLPLVVFAVLGLLWLRHYDRS